MALKILSRDQFGVTFSDPARTELKVRTKHTVSVKSAGGTPTDNHVLELIMTDTNPVMVGSTPYNDSLSVRLKISGTGLSKARLQQLAAALGSASATWLVEDALIGFSDLSVPVVPAPAAEA